MTQAFLSLFLVVFAQATFIQESMATEQPAANLQFQPYKEKYTSQKKMAFNIGYSQLERSSYVGPAASGLCFEAQNTFYKKILGTATFNHYDYSDTGGNSSFQMMALGGEVQPIQTELLGGSKFFSAVTAGGAFIFKRSGQNLYYGAAMGFKFNEDVGLRFDIKTGPSYITSNTISLIGYY